MPAPDRSRGLVIRDNVAASATAVGVTLAVVGATSFLLARVFWIADLLSNLLAHIALSLFFLGAFLWVLRCRRRALMLGLAGIVLAIPIFPYLSVPFSNRSRTVPKTASGLSHKAYRLVTYNILMLNEQTEEISDFLADLNADFVVLIEINQKWADEMEFELQNHFPHRKAFPRSDHYGIGIYSKHPWVSMDILQAGAYPIVDTTFELPEGKLRLLALHPAAPTNAGWRARRNDQYQQLATQIIAMPKGEALIVAGDFNCTPWSPVYRDFLKNTGLNDAGKGHGIHPTWKAANIPFGGIPIDHVLANEKVQFLSQDIGPGIGSDHRPVMVEFILTETP